MIDPIHDILHRLDHVLSRCPGDATFSLIKREGDLQESLRIDGSNHQRLIASAEIARLRRWMEDLPVLGACGADWSIAGGKQKDFNSPKITREYRCTMMYLDISRPASRRLKYAAEMISGAASRLREVEIGANAVGRPPVVYVVNAKAREERRILARSPREAAWTYAALYVRDRKEVRNWRATMAEVLRVAQIYPAEDWDTLPQDPGSPA